ncbi:MAG: thermonuclease family protein [Deltaproteobacteria bacterium]|nr:thermonuclease family protein [Deltaproteobacteria bacterium]
MHLPTLPTHTNFRLLSKKMSAGLALLLAGGMLSVPVSLAHPNDMDEFGGHFDERSGLYHYHKPRFDQSRLDEALNWTEFKQEAVVKGVLARVDRPDAVWIKIPYRPAFLDLAQYLPPSHVDKDKSLIQVWLLYVSTEISINEDKRYNAWFKERVVFEMRSRLEGKAVTVHLDLRAASQRPRGMVFFGEESLNLWLVLNGWSFYLLGEESGPYHESFIKAEDSARRRKVGLWQKR